MPPRGENPDFVRIVEGLARQRADADGVDHSFRLRRTSFRGSGRSMADWKRSPGPDGLILRTPIETRGKNMTTVAEFTVSEGERVPFVLTWFASHSAPPKPVHAEHALRDTEKYWQDWSNSCDQRGPWREAIMRSLIVLKV